MPNPNGSAFIKAKFSVSDIYESKKRSEIMSRVRSSGNKATEMRLIEIFNKLGIKGWRRKYPLPGKPDFTFPSKKLVIFVDGCFWHGCPIHGSIPNTNRQFWEKKLNRNIERDCEVNSELDKKGWLVIRIWQHELKDIDTIGSKLKKIFHS